MEMGFFQLGKPCLEIGEDINLSSNKISLASYYHPRRLSSDVPRASPSSTQKQISELTEQNPNNIKRVNT